MEANVTINDLPPEILSLILGPSLGIGWRFCARPVCRLWWEICERMPSESIESLASNGSHWTHNGTPFCVAVAKGRAVVAPVISRWLAICADTWSDENAHDVESWCRSLGANADEASATMIASGHGALIDYAIGRPRPYHRVMRAPPHVDLTRAILRHGSAQQIARYLDLHPLAAVEPNRAYKCPHDDSLFVKDHGPYHRRVLSPASDGYRPSRRDTSDPFYTALAAMHNNHQDEAARAVSVLWTMERPLSEADALCLFKAAYKRGWSWLRWMDTELALYAPQINPRHVIDALSRSWLVMSARDVTVFQWLYTESALTAPSHSRSGDLTETTCPLLHPEASAPIETWLTFLDYLSTDRPTALSAIDTTLGHIFGYAHKWAHRPGRHSDLFDYLDHAVRLLVISHVEIAPTLGASARRLVGGWIEHCRGMCTHIGNVRCLIVKHIRTQCVGPLDDYAACWRCLFWSPPAEVDK
ncbi:hypothetical protein pmac_cds_433 [Pandoravirus macleodensis]|uniref:SRCR domain-containing protein n=1 Tax=Pandoravirus macleodensis TaxID=2107707 RepID=A0A2U7UGJ1_9VIRU|nr:hypothetical protein pmac_cds_433 [Pandoravirus macleodensis]AVK77121.1 hypothetical protein pmac_cds_433 [Pandoravirus macleodensis]